MQQQPNQQQPTYYIVQPDQFNAMINTLASMPYSQVAVLLANLQNTSKAMFDTPPKFAGPGGQVVTPGQGNGLDPDPDAGQTDVGGAES